MTIRRRRKSSSLALQTFQLGVAAPQVVAHRMARMMIGGGSPSARQRRELQRMGTEKILAFNEAWSAMAMQAVLENQKLALSAMQTFWFPTSRELGDAYLGILGKGVAPIRRRAVANARRLRARRT
jgi:hypothetical protein